jgi:uncharacterized protein YjbJ (UPF0337 family)
MNDNQTEGIGKTIKGGVKEAASKLTGNKLGEVEGKAEKNVGKVQTKLGDKQAEHRAKQNPPE